MTDPWDYPVCWSDHGKFSANSIPSLTLSYKIYHQSRPLPEHITLFIWLHKLVPDSTGRLQRCFRVIFTGEKDARLRVTPITFEQEKNYQKWWVLDFFFLIFPLEFIRNSDVQYRFYIGFLCEISLGLKFLFLDQFRRNFAEIFFKPISKILWF